MGLYQKCVCGRVLAANEFFILSPGNVSGGCKCRSPRWGKLRAFSPNHLVGFEKPLRDRGGGKRWKREEREGRKIHPLPEINFCESYSGLYINFVKFTIRNALTAWQRERTYGTANDLNNKLADRQETCNKKSESWATDESFASIERQFRAISCNDKSTTYDACRRVARILYIGGQGYTFFLKKLTTFFVVAVKTCRRLYPGNGALPFPRYSLDIIFPWLPVFKV